MAKIIDLGLLGPDHPIYNGQIVFSSKKSKKESMTSMPTSQKNMAGQETKPSTQNSEENPQT